VEFGARLTACEDIFCKLLNYWLVLLPVSLTTTLVEKSRQRNLMFVQIDDGKKCVWVALVAIDLDSSPKQRLRQNQVCQCTEVKKSIIYIKELTEESLEAVKVVRRLRIKHFKVDIHNIKFLLIYIIRPVNSIC
jgi:hypothetical protein